MLSYILFEMLCDEHGRDRRAEADAERLVRACQLRPHNREPRPAAAPSSPWPRAYALDASCMLARARQAWTGRRSQSRAQSWRAAQRVVHRRRTSINASA